MIVSTKGRYALRVMIDLAEHQTERYVPLKETIEGFKEILSGKCDDMPEQAFYMVGNIEEAYEKAKTLKGE